MVVVCGVVVCFVVCDVWCEASVMSSLAPLFRELFAVCSNGVIPNLKFIAALKNCHATKKIYHDGTDEELWMPDTGGKLRMIAQKFRDIATNQQLYDRCVQKA